MSGRLYDTGGESEAERVERIRADFLTRMSQAGTAPRPSHSFQDWTYTEGGRRDYHDVDTCARCPSKSPFKGNRLAHPYVIDEDPI